MPQGAGRRLGGAMALLPLILVSDAGADDTRGMRSIGRPSPLPWLSPVWLVAWVLLCGMLHATDAAAARGPSAPVLTVEAALRERLAQLREHPATPVREAWIAAPALLSTFYERRGFAPAWACPRQRQALADAIERSRAHGLDPEDYHAGVLRVLLARPAPSPQEAADRDLLLSDAIVRLVYHLYYGKADLQDMQRGWHFTRLLRERDPARVLEALVMTRPLGPAVEGYAPSLPAYRDTMAALERHHAIAARGGW
ncbi:hypothetical protein OOT46_25390, partial [Aquabacterium sp. A7-Y]|uniref:hypothetical protein n=1 Tax=Aquabacterium sp. A7-Y TaxID=1349605 RepID=UPI00223E0CE6